MLCYAIPRGDCDQKIKYLLLYILLRRASVVLFHFDTNGETTKESICTQNQKKGRYGRSQTQTFEGAH